MRLERCTHADFLEILSDLGDFWGTDRARAVHHPMFVHEFADTTWVVWEEGRVIAYLFGFWSQAEPVGYMHLVAVRAVINGVASDGGSTSSSRNAPEHEVAPR